MLAPDKLNTRSESPHTDRLTADFFREFSDSFALDTADGQVFRSRSKLTLRSRGGRRAVRRAAPPFRVEHPFGRIRHLGSGIVWGGSDPASALRRVLRPS